MAKDVMRFAGPKMTFHHPLRALNHLWDKLRRVQHPLKIRRQRQAARRKERGAE